MIITGILLSLSFLRGLKGRYIHGTKNYYSDAGEDTMQVLDAFSSLIVESIVARQCLVLHFETSCHVIPWLSIFYEKQPFYSCLLPEKEAALTIYMLRQFSKQLFFSFFCKVQECCLCENADGIFGSFKLSDGNARVMHTKKKGSSYSSQIL